MVDTTKAWNAVSETWGAATAVFSKARPLQIIGTGFYAADEATDFAATPVQVVLSRTGLTIYGRDQEGNPKEDPTVIKNVQGIWPEIEGAPGTIVQVYVGAQDEVNSSIEWQGPRNFVLGSDFFLDFIVSGRYLAARFESLGQTVWTLTGYDLDIERVGGR